MSYPTRTTVDIVKGSNLARLISTLYPSYRKRKVFLEVFDEPVRQIGTSLGGWDGGSRSSDDVLSMLPSPNVFPAQQKAAFVNENTNPTVTLDENHAKVTTGTFCGKTATMSISCTKPFFEAFLQ